jgi:hypothetical protein
MVATALYLGAGVAAAAGVIRWVRSRTPAKERFHLFRCPGCEQKLRCRVSKSGRGGICPRCGLLWTMPTHAHALPVTARPGAGSLARVGRRIPVKSSTGTQPGSSIYGSRT